MPRSVCSFSPSSSFPNLHPASQVDWRTILKKVPGQGSCQQKHAVFCIYVRVPSNQIGSILKLLTLRLSYSSKPTFRDFSFHLMRGGIEPVISLCRCDVFECLDECTRCHGSITNVRASTVGNRFLLTSSNSQNVPSHRSRNRGVCYP